MLSTVLIQLGDCSGYKMLWSLFTKLYLGVPNYVKMQITLNEHYTAQPNPMQLSVILMPMRISVNFPTRLDIQSLTLSDQ
ncbi:CLUMA_CG006206, isoform A [Clunio marinus]|uniref:CLUMA_CG006206, isoform A n=1 Tax=Clunio marinus TaxID=568069 RepID=A0A1J1HYK6_9DIPT|nr:CLUMA_CG006206, isoform A [Clunio marinus]